MRLLFVLLFTVPLILMARENPFAPAAELDKTVNQEQVVQQSEPEPAAKPKVHPQRIETKTTVVAEKPKPKIHPQRKSYKKEVVNYSKARFVFRENSVYIETKDKIIRHFTIPNPPSIVIDFRAPSDFASKRKELTTKPFIKLEMGAHNNRYRVVLRLDKVHQYKIDRRKYGQVVTILD